MRELGTLVRYLLRYRLMYLLGLGCLLGSNLLGVVGPRLLGQGIDALGTLDPGPAVRRAAGLLVAAALAAGGLRYGMRQLINSASRRVEYDLRNDLFGHLLGLSAAFFGRTPTGDLMARATNDLLAVRMVAGPALMYLVDTFTRALIMLPVLLAISPPLTGLALIPLLGLPAVMVGLGRRIHEQSLAIQDHFGILTNFVHENVSGVRVVRAYRQETRETGAFAQLNRHYVDLNLRLARTQGVFHPLLGFLGGVSAVIVLAFGGSLVLRGRISTGTFVAFGVYLGLLVWPMIALGWAVALVQRGSASMERLNQLLAERTELPDPPAPAVLPDASGGRELSVEDVWFRFPDAADRGWVLQGVSLRIPAGGSAALVGATGSGKSALAELLVRTYDPDRGRITLDGVDLKDLPLAVLHRNVGFVPQDTFLFSETLRDNVLLGAPDDGRLERAAEGEPARRGAARPARRIRHPAGRAGHQPLGRAEAARRDRPRAGPGASGHDPRRRAQRGGRRHRGQDPAPAPWGAHRPHLAGDFPPRGRGARGGRDLLSGRGEGRGAGRLRFPARRGRALCRADAAAAPRRGDRG
jgi:ATP-binding cassette subfamily B multidrug efflux pump